MDIWQFIRESKSPVVLLYVTESRGSSPGRKGFKMAVRESGELCGSIGGGIMEQQLVDWAHQRLISGNHEPILRRQIHRTGKGEIHSGLICSGEQTVAFVVVDPDRFADDGYITLNEYGIQIRKDLHENTVYIIGGGHVGLALSRTMAQLDFRVEIFDDRAELNTIEINHFADEKHLGKLHERLNRIPEGSDSYVVAVTFGVATDRIVLKELANKHFRYFGMMGSEAKLRKLKEEFGPLPNIEAPIGLPINSHTPEEIAISIASSIINEKNSTPGSGGFQPPSG